MPDDNPSGFEIATTDFEIYFSSKATEFFSVSPKEIQLNESLLTPGLQTTIKLENEFITNFDTPPADAARKWWDDLKGGEVEIIIKKPGLEIFGYKKTDMILNQKIYRLGGRSATTPNAQDNRKMIGRTIEELTLHACDPTMLNDAGTLVAQKWKCTRPSVIVEHVLKTCAGAKNLSVERSEPARDYQARNIHPFQVVNQQATAALANGGKDPSFIHYMTYEKAESGQGTHHFKSLWELTKEKSIQDQLGRKALEYNRAGTAYGDPDSIMNYVFPCDFDLLSDILNGIDENGVAKNSLAVINPLNGNFSLHGDNTYGCGIGSTVYKSIMSNIGTEKSQGACPDYAYLYANLRQARLNLLEKDKIALRIVIPWNPIYNVGKVIKVDFHNYEDLTNADAVRHKLYGSGEYLISSLTHKLKAGGYGITTLDCVSKTVGRGEV